MDDGFKEFFMALSVRSQNAIHLSGCETMDDLRKFMADKREAMDTPNFGKKSYEEISQALSKIPFPKVLINELLDELQDAYEEYGFENGRSYPDGAYDKLSPARAAIDAEVKRMQDRIADLERELAYVKNAPAF